MRDTSGDRRTRRSVKPPTSISEAVCGLSTRLNVLHDERSMPHPAGFSRPAPDRHTPSAIRHPAVKAVFLAPPTVRRVVTHITSPATITSAQNEAGGVSNGGDVSRTLIEPPLREKPVDV